MLVQLSRSAAAILTAVLILGPVSDSSAGSAARSRSGGRAAGGVASGGGSAHGAVAHGGGPRVASGRATYGYHGGYRYAPAYRPYWRWYGGYWGLHGYWGPWNWWYGYPGTCCWGWPVVYPGYRYTTVSAGALPSPPARVVFDVKPRKAEVLVDGVEVGQARDYNGTWDRLDVEPGRRIVELRAEGYMTLRVELAAEPGGRYRLSERLQKGEGLDPRSAPATAGRDASRPAEATVPTRPQTVPPPTPTLQRGLLRLRVLPADAAVYLDGEFLARAEELQRLHGALPVAMGVHRVEVVRPGYVSQSLEVEVAGEQPVELEVVLDPGEF